MQLKKETHLQIQEIISRYPNKEAALIPVLYAVQDDLGWIADSTLDWVCEKLELSGAHALGVVSFYSMFRRKAPSRHRIEVCTNLSCSLMGAEHLKEYIERKLGVKAGGMTGDGLFSLHEVECLGSCGTAPVMLVNDDFHENVTPQSFDQLVDTLRRGG